MKAQTSAIRSPKRPLWMWVLLALDFGLILAGWTRMLTTIHNWYWLTFANLSPGPLYLAVTGGAWGLVGLIALVWLWQRRPYYRLVGTGAALFFFVTYWLDRLFVMKPASREQNVVFVAVTTILGLVYVWATLRPWKEISVLRKQNAA